MPEFVLLRLQVPSIHGIGGNQQRNPLDYLQAKPGDPDTFAGIVGEQANLGKPQFTENLRTDAEIAFVRTEAAKRLTEEIHGELEAAMNAQAQAMGSRR